MNTIETLKRAKQIMQERGRAQTKLVEYKGGSCCLLGAVGLAGLGEEFEKEALGLTEKPVDPYRHFSAGFYENPGGELYPVVELLGQEIDDWFLNYVDIYRFNDTNADDEVIYDAIDRAVAKAEEAQL